VTSGFELMVIHPICAPVYSKFVLPYRILYIDKTVIIIEQFHYFSTVYFKRNLGKEQAL
jgi:hypothetical protein